MQIYTGNDLLKYKKDVLGIDENWIQRDFVNPTKRYLEARTERILVIGGLRGTGKTVGALQAAENFDTAYIIAQKGDRETGKDYIELLKTLKPKCIIIDEYSWIKDRQDLDYYLLTAVQDGKRIVITGTESISLEMLNYGALCHRVGVLHTTPFPYEEYLRVFGLSHSAGVCDSYLMQGGLFKDYLLNNYESTREYIEKAIVENLSGYLGEGFSTDKARALTYSVLFKAVCPSNLSKVPVLQKSQIRLENFLDTMGVNVNTEIKDRDVFRVADIFEQIGVIIRVPNYDSKSPLKEQYYITNPSLTCQLIKAAYDLDIISNGVLGHVFESCVMVQLSNSILSDDKLFFLNSEGRSNVPTKELDIVVTDIDEEHVFFIECKHMKDDKLKSGATLLSGYLEENYFSHSEIDGRYVIYNGRPSVKDYGVGTIVFAPMGRVLDRYYEFEQNVNLIAPGHRIKNNNFNNNDEQQYASDVRRKVEKLKEDVPAIILQEQNRVQRVSKHLEHEGQTKAQGFEILD